MNLGEGSAPASSNDGNAQHDAATSSGGNAQHDANELKAPELSYDRTIRGPSLLDEGTWKDLNGPAREAGLAVQRAVLDAGSSLRCVNLLEQMLEKRIEDELVKLAFEIVGFAHGAALGGVIGLEVLGIGAIPGAIRGGLAGAGLAREVYTEYKDYESITHQNPSPKPGTRCVP